MSRMTGVFFVGLLTALATGSNAGRVDTGTVTLTMTEGAGAARSGEWITVGVPLPKGSFKSTEELCLLRDGESIPCEIIPVNRWWDDGTLRWVHLIFQGDCPADGQALVTLARGRQAPMSGQIMKVRDDQDRFIVDTGAVSFEVRKKSFNVLDAVKVGDETIINTHKRGLIVYVEGQEYCAAPDPNATVVLEEKGPLHAVLRARGSMRNAEGWRKFDFDCRLYAHAGSPEVKIVVTLMNRQRKDTDYIPLSSLSLELPTAIRAGDCLFGTEDGGAKRGTLSASSEAYVYQMSSDEHVFGGAVQGKGGGKQAKSANIGWGCLSDGRKGVGAGIRWFWQLHPKSVEFTGDGIVRVGLYTSRHKKPLKIYTGVARTHEVRLCFSSGGMDEAELKGRFAGLQRPLRPFAPPKWYCRDTQAMGDYCEAGGDELYGRFAGDVAAFDEAFESANRRCQDFRDSRTIKSVETDSYGFLGFGDGVHHVWTPGVDVPENISWDGNYYGYPHMMCIQFMRTGNREYFDNFEAHALHVADVHVVHHSEKPHLVGGCRYCPPTDHVRIDPTDSSDYRTAKVYVSKLFNHHKIAGVIERWYFLRDHRCLDVANMVLDYCYRWKYGDNDYGQPRGPGIIMDFCYQGYMLTGDKKWIERAANVLRVHKGRDLKLSFQAGIFLEGMRRYYEMSGDEEALAYIRDSVDRLISEGRKGGVTAQAHSFMYLKTGEQKYLDAALDNLPRNGLFDNPWKNFALSMRNAAMCIGDLHRVAEKGQMDLRLGGCGGVYFYAPTGELWVEVQKQDLNVRANKTHLRALLFAPDRSVVDEAWLNDDGLSAGSVPGPVQRAMLRTNVQRPGVYGLNITVTEDRYGEKVSWGFKSNCRNYLVETSRGHKDARHEEPIVLRNAGRQGNVGFMPVSRAFSVDVGGLAKSVKDLAVYDSDGKKITTLAVSPEGKAHHDFPADETRKGELWRLHLDDAQAVINIDGVTRWQSGERWENLSLWTPDLSSWFAFHENRWLLTPYSPIVYDDAGSEGTVNFVVHNNSPAPKRVKLSLECEDNAAWSVALSKTDVEIKPNSSVQTPLKYKVLSNGAVWKCYVRATVDDETEFSTWSSVTLRRGVAPAMSPLKMPIKLEPYRHENEQFGYLPDYPLDNQVYFDVQNRPFLVSGDGVFHLSNGAWTKTTEAYRPEGGRTISIRPLGTKIAFDRDNDVYLLGRDGSSTVLLHSADGGEMFTAWPVPGSGSFDIEQFSGHNVIDGPPPLARFHQTASDPKLIWRRINDLDLILPVKKAEGSIAMGEPIAISKKCIGLSAHSGIPSTIVSSGDRVHITWGEATPPEAKSPGVPTYVATYDRSTGRLSTPALVGYGPPANDVHNSPCITMDGKGYLHVLIGTHGRTFKYVRSLTPNSANGAWTGAEDVGAGLRQTYVGMVCDQNDTLHLVFRLWLNDNEYFPAGYYANLAYMSKRPTENWSQARPLVVAPFSEYSIFYHRLTIDRKGALFLSYDYWSTFWFYRTDHFGDRRALLMSPDGGVTWELAPSSEFGR